MFYHKEKIHSGISIIERYNNTLKYPDITMAECIRLNHEEMKNQMMKKVQQQKEEKEMQQQIEKAIEEQIIKKIEKTLK